MEDRGLPAQRSGGITPDAISFEAICASLGSLLLLWSSIEKAFHEKIVMKTGSLPKAAHGMLATMRCWRTVMSENERETGLRPLLVKAFLNELHQSLIVRNGLCHGLVEIVGGDNESAYLGWKIANKQGRICWADLQKMFAWLSKVRYL